jgi:hypothetical protein
MLRWISKSGTFFQFTIFILFMVLLWIPAFLSPIPPVRTAADGPLYILLVSWLQPFPELAVAMSLLLVVLQSVVLFYVYQANGFFGRSNFLPAIIILLAYSWNAGFQTMHSILPAGVFLIIALNSIMIMYGRQAAFHQVFTAAFSIGVAMLFSIPLAYMLLLVWFTLITFRISTWREYAVSIIGFSLPFIYFVSWLFWNDNVVAGLKQISTAILNFILPGRLSLINTIWLSASAFILVVTMVAVLNIMNDKLISLRRRAWVLFNFSFTAIVAILLSGWPILNSNYIFVIPLSFFITGSFSLVKKPFWFEMLVLGYFLLLTGIRLNAFMFG